nr:hypothetical protein [Tanacetum cinerariifolium]
MIAFLTKSDASEGFDQIVDFLNAKVIQYALMVNPTIYVSCIKQFWTSVSIKRSNDVVRLQALIDRKKVIITEDSIRQALQLDDVDGVDCLPNEEIFVELARMGYEKPSTKLTFYKAFFSAQWSLIRNVDSPSKFLMYPRFLQLMINAQIANLSSHTTKYTSTILTQKVFASMRRIGKGFSGVDTPLFDGMLVQQQAQDVEDAAEDENDYNETCATLTKQVTNLEQDKIAQAIEVTKLKQRVRRLKKKRRMHPNRGKFTALDANEDVTLEVVDAEVAMDADVHMRLPESQAKNEIEEEGSKRKSKSFEQKVAKKQRIDEEEEKLKRHLQIVVNDDDDDVFTEATPLALKMFFLVEKKYHLTRFTLEQMLNNVRLEVEEEGEMSLELLRLMRR